jgi:hypothetical protein
MVLSNEVLDGPKSRLPVNIHFTPLAHDVGPQSSLIMFEVVPQSVQQRTQKNDSLRAPLRYRQGKVKSHNRGQSKAKPRRRK